MLARSTGRFLGGVEDVNAAREVTSACDKSTRSMRILLVGSGGREHALAWKIARSPLLTELHCAPGNPGIARHAQCHPVRAEDAEGLLGLARELGVDLVVIGPG